MSELSAKSAEEAINSLSSITNDGDKDTMVIFFELVPRHNKELISEERLRMRLNNSADYYFSDIVTLDYQKETECKVTISFEKEQKYKLVEELYTNFADCLKITGFYNLNPELVKEKYQKKMDFLGTGKIHSSLDVFIRDVFKFDDMGDKYICKGFKAGFNGVLNYLRIPAYYKNKPVVGIDAEAFTGRPFVKVVIPNTVEIIGYDAFKDCNLLTEVKIPRSVRVIGTRAFKNCSSLRRVLLPIDCEVKLGESFDKTVLCEVY